MARPSCSAAASSASPCHRQIAAQVVGHQGGHRQGRCRQQVAWRRQNTRLGVPEGMRGNTTCASSCTASPPCVVPSFNCAVRVVFPSDGDGARVSGPSRVCRCISDQQIKGGRWPMALARNERNVNSFKFASRTSQPHVQARRSPELTSMRATPPPGSFFHSPHVHRATTGKYELVLIIELKKVENEIFLLTKVSNYGNAR